MKKTVFHICENRIGQRFSICDYWKGTEQVEIHPFMTFLKRDWPFVPGQTLTTGSTTWGATASWRCSMETDLTLRCRVSAQSHACWGCCVWRCVFKLWLPPPPPHIFSVEGKLPAHQEAGSDWRTRRWCHHTLAVQVYFYWYFISKLSVVNAPILSIEIIRHNILDLFIFLHWLRQFLVLFYWQKQLASTEKTDRKDIRCFSLLTVKYQQ